MSHYHSTKLITCHQFTLSFHDICINVQIFYPVMEHLLFHFRGLVWLYSCYWLYNLQYAFHLNAMNFILLWPVKRLGWAFAACMFLTRWSVFSSPFSVITTNLYTKRLCVKSYKHLDQGFLLPPSR